MIGIGLRRKLERLRREVLLYGAALLAFALVMYFITSEAARDALAFGRP